jgi:serine/threonine-protein kinase HipA
VSGYTNISRADSQRCGTGRFADLLFQLEIRVGLPGVQDKVRAAMLNLPFGQAEERYVLKRDTTGVPAPRAGRGVLPGRGAQQRLHAASAQDADGRPGLLVRRFDRVAEDGVTVPLGLEDGCQVLDPHPTATYRLP